MKKPTEKKKEAIAQSDAGDALDGATDRAIETREQVSAEAADEGSAETVNRSSVEGEESAESRMRLSKTNRYDFGVVSAATHKSMQGNKRRDTKPEVLVRRMLRRWLFPAIAAIGEGLVGPMMAFVGRKLAIEIRGVLLASLSGVQLVGAQEEPRLLGGSSPPQRRAR